MVVNPSQLLEKANRKEQKKLAELETRVDECLAAFDGNPVTIAADLFTGLRSNIVNKFLDKYRRESWSIERFNDQRDGDYFQFSYSPRERYVRSVSVDERSDRCEEVDDRFR